MSSDFAACIAYRILIHEAHGNARLTKKPFESALVEAWRATGFDATQNPSSTHPGHDLTVYVNSSPVRVSCKTQADRQIKEGFIFISKLMEMAAIQELREAPGRTGRQHAASLVPRVIAQMRRSDLHLVLRCFERTEHGGDLCRRYDLVEMPGCDGLGLTRISGADFMPLKENGGTYALGAADDQGRYCKLIYDGSDQKVQLKVPIGLCRHHWSWFLPYTE